jgi:type VI secretion system protein ImpJ
MQVHWHEGLFLQPHHLQTMQHRLQRDIRSARALLAPFCFGIIESRLSHDDLADGRIRFEYLKVIMPSGQEVFFPEDANLPALDIKAELVRGAGPLEVLLAVPLWARKRANAFRQGESADPRVKLLYIPEEAREVADENTGENPQVIHIRKINARIVHSGDDVSDMEFLPLLRVVRSSGEESGKPRQDPEFVPPSLLLRSSPTLHGLARDLVAQIDACREQNRVKASTGGLGLEVKWELTMRLTTLSRFCGSLPSIVEEGIVSPFHLYLQLRELLGELMALHPQKTNFACQPYDHLDPFRSLKELDLRIRELIRVAPGRDPLRVPFAGVAGLLRAELEAQHFEKPTGYYLGVKTRVERTKLALYLVDGNKFKLMPRSMEQMAIFGMELKELNNPPLELPGQNDLHYFGVSLSSNPRRWDQIRQDKAVSLVWNNTEFDLSDAVFTLYMTLPATP